MAAPWLILHYKYLEKGRAQTQRKKKKKLSGGKGKGGSAIKIKGNRKSEYVRKSSFTPRKN